MERALFLCIFARQIQIDLQTLIEDISSLIPKREKTAHKGDFGHTLIIAGSRGKMGAAVLATHACLKTGAGLVTSLIPRCGEIILQVSVPEAMVITSGNEAIDSLPDLDNFRTIGIGPGIGTRQETVLMLLDVFLQFKHPIVIDADAINLIAGNASLRDKLPAGCILTPHPKELERISKAYGLFSSYYQETAVRLAQQTGCFVVLKGANTAICTPEAKVFYNTTGNPGMATAGSGDVLTGMIAGLLSQNYTALDACLVGVYLHGLAGDIAAAAESEESLIAGDIIANIGKAYRVISG